MNVIYFKDSGRILSLVGESQYYKTYYEPMGEDFVNKLTQIVIKDIAPNILMNINKYIIVDGEFVEISNLEMNEFYLFDRILSEEERIENKLIGSLMLSYDEIKKAKRTIEYLELMSEVL